MKPIKESLRKLSNICLKDLFSSVSVQRISQYISAEQGVACPLGGQVRFPVFLKVNGGIPDFSSFISEILPRKKICYSGSETY